MTTTGGLPELWQANYTDIPRTVIAELGWSLSLWNGGLGGASATTSLHCGCTVKQVRNNALVKVTRDNVCGIENAAAVELLKQLIDLWDADSGTVTQSTWNEERQVRDEVEIATYERRRWPVLFPKGAMRHADGLLRLAG